MTSNLNLVYNLGYDLSLCVFDYLEPSDILNVLLLDKQTYNTLEKANVQKIIFAKLIKIFIRDHSKIIKQFNNKTVPYIIYRDILKMYNHFRNHLPFYNYHNFQSDIVHFIIYLDSYELFKLFLQVNPNLFLNYTSLTLMIDYNRQKMLKAGLYQSNNMSLPYTFFFRLLHYSAENSYPKSFEKFLEYIQCNFKSEFLNDTYINSILHLLVLHKSEKYVYQILKDSHSFTVDINFSNLINSACFHKNSKMLRLLLIHAREQEQRVIIHSYTISQMTKMTYWKPFKYLITDILGANINLKIYMDSITSAVSNFVKYREIYKLSEFIKIINEESIKSEISEASYTRIYNVIFCSGIQYNNEYIVDLIKQFVSKENIIENLVNNELNLECIKSPMLYKIIKEFDLKGDNDLLVLIKDLLVKKNNRSCSKLLSYFIG
jgi:hypothetical protein